MRRRLSFALSLIMVVAFVWRSGAPIAGAGNQPLTVDHYVRLKSTAPAMSGQMAHLYVCATGSVNDTKTGTLRLGYGPAEHRIN
jgi:hypothetical protein